MMGLSPQCYLPSFVEIGLSVLEMKIFKRFLPNMGMAESVVVSGRILNSFKLSRISSSPARMITKELEWSQYFSHYKSMGIFPDAQGQLTPDLHCPILPNFELVRDAMEAPPGGGSLLPSSLKIML